MDKIGVVILGLLLLSSLNLYPFHSTGIANAQSTSNKPSWAVPGIMFSYGWQLWEYFPLSNVSSAISFMEQNFALNSSSYTPKREWDSILNLKLISADSQKGVFQLSIGNQTATWDYIWSNHQWQVNEQQVNFPSIYIPPEQLSNHPLVTIGNYQAYKVSRNVTANAEGANIISRNVTLYEYYQKDTGILLLLISVGPIETNPLTGEMSCDLFVTGLISTSVQILQVMPSQTTQGTQSSMLLVVVGAIAAVAVIVAVFVLRKR